MDVSEIALSVKAELDRIGNDYMTRQARYEKHLDEMSAALTRLSRGNPGELKVESEADRAFKSYLRKGVETLEPLERKALTVSDDPRGGFLAPAETAREIIRLLREASPMRRLGRTLDTTAGSLELPKQTAGTAAAWVGEVEQRTESNLDFGQVDLPLHELATYVDASARLLEDSAFDIESLMNQDLAEAFAAAESTAFLTGNGVKKPTGILAAADLVTVPSGDANLITGDGLISLAYKLKPSYRRNAAWLMNNTTAAAVRKLKSAADGTYLWQDQGRLIAGQPPTLLGYPVEIDDGMPNIAAGSHPILFGDFGRAFFIVGKANGMSVLRDPYSVATTGKVRFHARMRVGAALVRSEAIAAQRIATS
jgi:HK97 family phage major capsid protein